MEFKESIENIIGQLRRYSQRHNTGRFESHLKSLERSVATELTPDKQIERVAAGARILVFPCKTPAEAVRICRTVGGEA